jgi:hypothetical protein
MHRCRACPLDGMWPHVGHPMRAIRLSRRLVMGLFLVALALVPPLQATGDMGCLLDTITQAPPNGEAQRTTFAAGTDPLKTVHHNPDGATGLPSMTSPRPITGPGTAIPPGLELLRQTTQQGR